MLSLKFVLHYSLHFLAPGIIGYVYQPKNWKKNWLILLSTMLIDVDHLLANPIFQEDRCSINYHPLHTFYAAIVYVTLIIPNKTRLFAMGLIFHLITDLIDCSFG